ncbi:MAG: hypothetical protein OEV80_16690, partial [candidate division Zixibacteria bacterium]|nr:hypothetical protein [candidate division Zixibacteria bacterium]
IPGTRKPVDLQPWTWYVLTLIRTDDPAPEGTEDEEGYAQWFDAEDLVTDGRSCMVALIDDVTDEERETLANLFAVRGEELS